jgi:hypothetical protein
MDKGRNLIWQGERPSHFAAVVNPQTNRFATALMAELDFSR